MANGKKSCAVEKGGVEVPVTYIGDNSEVSTIISYNGERKVKNVRFENLRINGLLISDNMLGKTAWYKTSDMARIFVGEYVEGVTFDAKPVKQ